MTTEQAAQLIRALNGLTTAVVIIMVCTIIRTLITVIGGGEG